MLCPSFISCACAHGFRGSGVHMEHKILAGVVGFFVVISLIVFSFHSYNGVALTEAFSFWVADGWCDPSRGEGVGFHCFGDFGFPYSRGGGELLYADGNLAAANTPFVAVAFLGLELLPYNAALAFYLAIFLGLVCLVLQRHKSETDTSILVSLPLVLLSVGVWAAFDRGNHVLVYLPIVYFLICWTRDGRMRRVLFLLILAGLLKWWGPLLVLIPLAVGYLRVALASVAGTVIGHFAFLSIYPEDGFLTRVRLTFAAVTDSAYAEHQSQYAVSGASFIGRVVCAWPGGADCQNVLPRAMISGGNLTVAVVSLVFAGLCFAVVRIRGLDDNSAVFAAASLCFLAVPDAVVYNLVAASAAALLIRENLVAGRERPSSASAEKVSQSRRVEYILLALALGASVVPLAFVNIEGLPPLMPPLLGAFGSFKFAAVAVPLSSLLLLVFSLGRSLSARRTH